MKHGTSSGVVGVALVAGGCLAGCSSSTEPNKPANSTAIAQVAASVPAGAVTSVAVLPGAQDYEDGVASERVLAFALALDAFSRACASGHGRACVREAGYYFLGLRMQRDPDRAITLLRRACKNDHWLACTYDAFLCVSDADPPCKGEATTAKFDATSWARVDASCNVGVAEACLLRGFEDLAKKNDEAGWVAKLSQACDAGALDGCLLLVITGVAKASRSTIARAPAVLQRACDLGNGEACASLASLGGADQLKALTLDDRTRALLERACLSEPTKFYLASLPAPEAPMVGGSCAVLAAVLEKAGEEPERMRSLTERACKLGVVSRCGRR